MQRITARLAGMTPFGKQRNTAAWTWPATARGAGDFHSDNPSWRNNLYGPHPNLSAMVPC